MATSMRRQAGFWEDQENTIVNWQSNREKYRTASVAVPAAPDDGSSTGSSTKVRIISLISVLGSHG
jgi:hypothetical protein